MAGLRVVGASDAVNWYKGGWEIFKSNIANWILMALIFLVITVILVTLIPFVGPIAFYLLLPIFIGGMLYSAQQLDRGQQADIMDLFVMFKDQQNLTQLIILGLILLVTGFLSVMLVGGMMVASVDLGTVSNSGVVTLPSIGMGGFFMALIVAILSFMLFMFTVPLIIFRKMSAIDAIKNSFMACVKNFPAFMLFMGIYFLLGLAVVITFGLGLLVLLPLMIATIYVAYKRLFA